MDDWYDSLDKVINELKSTPSCHWFLKPVSKKDVKDYHTGMYKLHIAMW